MTDQLRQAAQQAMEALENAVRYHGIMLMADPPQDAWKYHRVEDNAKQAITAIKKALAQPVQPVQEPVACRFCHDKKGCWTWQCYHCGEIDDVQKPTPPAVERPWQGLTEDEKFEMAAAQYGWEDLLIAAEAKLKDKNNG